MGLEVNIPGVPGEDYPIYASVPDTGFTCDGLVEGGYYADPASECQAFHICANDGAGGLITYSVLCPNGTIFNQEVFVCDWWFNLTVQKPKDFTVLMMLTLLELLLPALLVVLVVVHRLTME